MCKHLATEPPPSPYFSMFVFQGPSTLEPTVPAPVGTVPVGNLTFLKLLLSSSPGLSAPKPVCCGHLCTATLGAHFVLLSIALPSTPLSRGEPQAGAFDTLVCVQGSGLSPRYSLRRQFQCEVPNRSPENPNGQLRGTQISGKGASFRVVLPGQDRGPSFLRVCL